MSASSPRYVWPLLVTATAAAAAAAGAAREAADDADALLGKVRTLAEKLDVSGPVQRAWQLSYTAVDPQADADGPAGGGGRRPQRRGRRSSSPIPAAIALVRAAAIALSGAGGREAAAARLRRAGPIAERLGAGPLARADR